MFAQIFFAPFADVLRGLSGLGFWVKVASSSEAVIEPDQQKPQLEL